MGATGTIHQEIPMSLRLLAAAAIAAAWASAFIAAQSPPSPAIETSITIDRALVKPSPGGGFDGLGRNYKVHAHGSLTFIPRGTEDRATHGTTFTPARVGFGDVELPVTPAAPVLDGVRVETPFGDWSEIDDLLPDGVEQMFRFGSRKAEGALAIEIETGTELEIDGPRVLVNRGDDRLSYGEAALIDARGRRFAMSTSVAGGRIRLVASAETMRAAEFPVVVDPLIATMTPSAGIPYPVADVDVASDSAGLRRLVVLEAVFSATDHDLWSRHLDSNGAIIAPPNPNDDVVDFSTADWRRPRVAANAVANNFLAAAIARATPAATTTSVMCVVIPANSFTNGPAVAVEEYPGLYSNVDVGGDPSPASPTYYAVVYEREFNATDHDVFLRMVSTAGQPATLHQTAIEGSSTYAHNPVISSSDGLQPASVQNWTIAWEQGQAPNRDIYARRVSWSGAVTATFPVEVSAADATNPAVSSIDGAVPHRMAVGYELHTTSPTDVYFALVENGTVISVLPGMNVMLATANVARTAPAVETTGCGFVASMVKTATQGIVVNDAVEAIDLIVAPNTGLLTLPNPPLVIPGGAAFHDDLRIATDASMGVPSHRRVFACTSFSVFAASSATLSIDDASTTQAGVIRLPMMTDCLGIDMSGAPTPGATIAFGLDIPGPGAALIFGIPAANASYCGLSIGVDLSQNYFLIPGGYLTAAIPNAPNLIGFSFAVQGADLAGQGCLGYRVSDTLIVQIY